MTGAQDTTPTGPVGKPGERSQTDPEIARLSYEEAREALVEVVRRLESGATTLEESLTLWERGEALADFCQSWLEAARTRLTAAQTDRADQTGQTGQTEQADGPAATTTSAASTATEEEEDPWHTR